MTATTTAAVPYRIRWRPEGTPDGAHPGRAEGGGAAFRRHVPLIQHPDPRRVDVRRSLSDPTGTIQVRQFTRRQAITVTALVDLSGSMGFRGEADRRQVVTSLCATLALSACQMGDRFGLIGCGAGALPLVELPPTRRRGLEQEAAALLAAMPPGGRDGTALEAAADRLPRRRSLVVLISDFLFPLPRLEALLDRLGTHDVAPVVLHDPTGTENLPRWGLMELRDLETGQPRLVLLRPSLRAAWQRAAVERRAALDRLLRRTARGPLHITGAFDGDQLAEYLLHG